MPIALIKHFMIRVSVPFFVFLEEFFWVEKPPGKEGAFRKAIK
jgi:hypothetical protein